MAKLGRLLWFGARTVRRSPGFALTVVATLALGIAASVLVLSALNSALVRPIGMADESRLVYVVSPGALQYDAISPPEFFEWQQQLNAFDAIGTYVWSAANLGGRAVAPVRLRIADVTSNWFTLLGAHMQLGRGLLPSEEGRSAPRVTVLSSTLWRTQFDADSAVLGRTVLLDGTPYTVVGVAEPDFTFPDAADLWRPMVLSPNELRCSVCPYFWGPVARLKPGVTLEQARRDVRAAAARFRAEHPSVQPTAVGPHDIVPLRRYIVGNVRPALLLSLGAAACLLLLACANVATLQVVRTASRSSEIGIRIALGARPQHIIALLLGESIVLAIAGGAVGVGLAECGLRAVNAAGLATLPLLANVSINGRVLVCALVITVVTSILFGLVPARRAIKNSAMHTITTRTRGMSVDIATSRLRNVLVAVELSLTVPLVIGAALLGKSLDRLTAVKPGFEVARVVRFDLTLPQCGTTWVPDSTCVGGRGSRYNSPAAIHNFTQQLVALLRGGSGIQAVAAGIGVPFTNGASNQTRVRIAGRSPTTAGYPDATELKSVTDGYFGTLHIPMLRGRAFTDDDRLDGRQVAIVSKAFVDAYMAGMDPIGAVIEHFGEEWTIVGVVGDTKATQIGAAFEPAVYRPFAQAPSPWITVLVRSTADPRTVMASARERVAALDAAVPVFNAMRMEDALTTSTAVPRLVALCVGGFAGAALALAAVGLHGLISYAIRQRWRELGIRRALGARDEHVVRLAVAWGLGPAVGGLGIGLVGSIGEGRVLRGLLYGTDALDLTTYAEVCTVLLAVALVASWIAARRATQVDPMEALRAE